MWSIWKIQFRFSLYSFKDNCTPFLGQMLCHIAGFLRSAVLYNRASQSVVLTTGQKMALRPFYFIRTLTKALSYYYINRSQRHFSIAIENNRFGVPIDLLAAKFCRKLPYRLHTINTVYDQFLIIWITQISLWIQFTTNFANSFCGFIYCLHYSLSYQNIWPSY